jgi:putative copper export protein
MLPVTWNATRLFLHVLAATVWVGGQIALAGMVPGARKIDPGLPKVLARRFNAIAWPAFGVLFVTGLWNLAVVSKYHRHDTAWGITLFVKLVVVALSGVSAFLHQRSKGTLGLAVWGSLTGASAIGALWVGIMLHG